MKFSNQLKATATESLLFLAFIYIMQGKTHSCWKQKGWWVNFASNKMFVDMLSSQHWFFLRIYASLRVLYLSVNGQCVFLLRVVILLFARLHSFVMPYVLCLRCLTHFNRCVYGRECEWMCACDSKWLRRIPSKCRELINFVAKLFTYERSIGTTFSNAAKKFRMRAHWTIQLSPSSCLTFGSCHRFV